MEDSKESTEKDQITLLAFWQHTCNVVSASNSREVYIDGKGRSPMAIVDRIGENKGKGWSWLQCREVD